MGRRLERVASLLKEEISYVILHELNDPRTGFVTVTGVKPSPDLQQAMVYVSILGTPSEIRRGLRTLNNAKGRIQGLVSQRAILRYTPRLHFMFDESIAGVARITKLIQDSLPPDAQKSEGEGEEE